jgi:hypothetical protein
LDSPLPLLEGFTAMRRFMLGSVTDQKIVVIELNGTRLSVVRRMPDGSTKRKEQELSSEAEARGASEQVARELISRGYVEQIAGGPRPAKVGRAAAQPATSPRELEEVNAEYLLEVDEVPAGTAVSELPRLAATPNAMPAAGSAPKKKPKMGGKKKKKKKSESDDALDKRVLAGIVAVGVLFIGFIGFFIYDAFLKPPTIVGVWRGSMLEHEISRLLTYTQYDLILDEQKRASLTLQEKYTSVGTYSLKGKRLKLTFTDEDGFSSERQFKIVLRRSTLDLIDPESGKLQVQLIRFREKPVVKVKTPPPAVPKELAAGGADTVD